MRQFVGNFENRVLMFIPLLESKEQNMEPYRPWKELKVQLCSRNWKMTEFQGQILHWISRQKIAFSTYIVVLAAT